MGMLSKLSTECWEPRRGCVSARCQSQVGQFPYLQRFVALLLPFHAQFRHQTAHKQNSSSITHYAHRCTAPDAPCTPSCTEHTCFASLCLQEHAQ